MEQRPIRPEEDPGYERPDEPLMETTAAEEARTRPVDTTPADTTPAASGAGMSMAGYRERFEALQSEFIEQPKEAVEKAESLIEEAVDQVMNSLRERVRSVHAGIGEGDDTERLRVAMRGYRELIDSIEDRF